MKIIQTQEVQYNLTIFILIKTLLQGMSATTLMLLSYSRVIRKTESHICKVFVLYTGTLLQNTGLRLTLGEN